MTSAAACAQPPAPASGVEALQRYLERTREAAAAQTAAEREQRLHERSALLVQGEAALANGDVGRALGAFERAALMLHAADTEMALVRTYMQAGEYRRAVSFSAHTAGAHRQVIAGAVLYAWLLSRGGQDDAARRLLAAAQHESHDPLLREAQQLMASTAGLPRGALMEATACCEGSASRCRRGRAVARSSTPPDDSPASHCRTPTAPAAC